MMFYKYVIFMMMIYFFVACDQKNGGQVEELNLVPLNEQINTYIKKQDGFIAVIIKIINPGSIYGNQ